MSYSTYPIKLQLHQLILPTVNIELKGMDDLQKEREKDRRKEKNKERGQKSQCKRKERQPNPFSQIREVCYPQGAIVE